MCKCAGAFLDWNFASAKNFYKIYCRKVARYCLQQCQAAHWVSHKAACQNMSGARENTEEESTSSSSSSALLRAMACRVWQMRRRIYCRTQSKRQRKCGQMSGGNHGDRAESHEQNACPRTHHGVSTCCRALTA
jgi:hypothetical protein